MLQKMIGKDIEDKIDGIDDQKISCCDKCFEFWGYKHPYLLLVLWICAMFTMGIIISSFTK